MAIRARSRVRLFSLIHQWRAHFSIHVVLPYRHIIEQLSTSFWNIWVMPIVIHQLVILKHFVERMDGWWTVVCFRFASSKCILFVERSFNAYSQKCKQFSPHHRDFFQFDSDCFMLEHTHTHIFWSWRVLAAWRTIAIVFYICAWDVI